MKNKKTAIVFLRTGGRIRGFGISNRIEIPYNADYSSLIPDDFSSDMGEIKIQFPKILRGTATGKKEWIIEELSDPKNWEEDWKCSRCGKKFPTLNNILTTKQMDELDERFPWTCPDCYLQRIKIKLK